MPGTNRIAPASTFPAGPGRAATTSTLRTWHFTRRLGGVPERIATGTRISSVVANSTPLDVRTIVPEGIV